MEVTEVKQKAARSILALTGRTIFLQVVSFGAFFLLGIFLAPQALGIFIAVSALIRLFSLFTDVGLGAALIQKSEDTDDQDLATAFTLQTILVVTVIIAGLVITPLVRTYGRLNDQGIFLYWILLTTLFVSSLKTIPAILLERKLAFEKQIIPQIVEALIFNFLVVTLAYLGYGVASYSWSILVSALVGLPVYYLISPWRPRLALDLTRVKKLLSFGLSYQGKNVLAVVKDDLLTVFLTGMVGTSGIGYWGWAHRWAYSPFRVIVDSVTKVTFPAYSRLQHDKVVLKEVVEKSLFGVSLVMFPVLALMITLIQEAVALVPRYAKWEPAIGTFIFLCLGAGVSSVSNILVNTLDALGKVRTTLKLMILWIFLTWILTPFLVWWLGFTGIAVASFAVSLTIVLTIHLVKKEVAFSVTNNIGAQFLASLLAATLIIVLSAVFPGGGLFLLAKAVLGFIIYWLVLKLLMGERLDNFYRAGRSLLKLG